LEEGMKKLGTMLLIVVLAVSVFAGGTKENGKDADTEYKIAWYASAVHPYFDEVQKGVKKFVLDTGIEVRQQIGPDWTQDSETQNIEALAAMGFKGFSVYPSDPAAANGLYEELVERGISIVNFGTSTVTPTPASFAVATDVKYAAMQAAEKLIDLMGGKGNILNVLEVVTDANTVLRKDGIEEVVANYPDVNIIQEVGDITSVEEGLEKISSAISAKRNEIDGIICTGFTTTVAATQLVSEINTESSKRLFFIGIDEDPSVMDAIRKGTIDGTVAQNPFGHGYISMMILKLMQEGYTVRDGMYFVNAGMAIVTKENIDSYSKDLEKVTNDILDTLTTEYLTK
jgi:ribose transport system substrate-binding protein